MTTLREFFDANSYRIKVDKYPFTDEYETTLGTQEALMSVKGFFLEKRQDLVKLILAGGTPDSQATRWLTIAIIDELLETELKDIFLPKHKSPVIGKQSGDGKE
jgi:hypothetical protein